MGIFGYIQVYMGVQGYIWVCQDMQGIYGYIWVSLDVYGYVRPYIVCMGMNRYIWVCKDNYGYVQVYMTMSVYYGYIKIYMGLNGYVLGYSCLQWVPLAILHVCKKNLIFEHFMTNICPDIFVYKKWFTDKIDVFQNLLSTIVNAFRGDCVYCKNKRDFLLCNRYLKGIQLSGCIE